MKKIIFLGKVGLGLTILTSLNEKAYITYVGLKRSSIALYYEGKIFINYKMNGFNDDSHDYCARQLSKIFSINKGPSIKLAQNLAQHHHVLPEPFIKHMEPFLQKNPTTSFDKVKKLFKQQTKKEIYDVFDYIEENPVASGSIAQVHKAKLTGTYDYVAMKIQHPEIINQTKGDLLVVYYSCKLAEYFFPGVKVMWIYKDFNKNMSQEIDFLTEVKNIWKAKSLFKSEKRIVIPKVYEELSTERLITMSFEEGKSICDKQYQKENKINSNEISHLLNTLFNKQIFTYGFVHADPHHGNLFMRKEIVNGRPKLKIVLLDFGLFMNLDNKLINDYANLWRGIFLQNYKIIEESCLNLGVKDPQVFTSMVTGKAFDEVMDSSNKHDYDSRLKSKCVSKEKVKKFIDEHFKTILINLEYGREEIPLLLKIVDYLRSNDHKLGTDINTYSIMMEYVYKRMLQDYKSKGWIKRAMLFFEYWYMRFGLYWVGVAFRNKQRKEVMISDDLINKNNKI